MMRGPLIVLLLLLLYPEVQSQQMQWAVLEFGGVECHFPTPYDSIKTREASGVVHDGGVIYMAITALPDTISQELEDQTDYRRLYNQIISTVLRRLGGQLKIVNDTVIDGTLASYSSLEVAMPDSAISNYDLIQLARNDSIYAFSCQYPTANETAVAMRDYFFKNLSAADSASELPVASVWSDYRTRIILGVFLFLFIAGSVFYIVRRNRSS